MTKQINWLEGRIKEVAEAYHEVYGIYNITYEVKPNMVIFKTDGYFFTAHQINGGI